MKLKILGFNVPVKYVSNELLGENIGLYHGRHNEIFIDKDCDKQVQNDTLIHEIIECLNMNLELDLQHSQITAISTGLYQVIKDNKKVFMEM